jgi:hypothetical protein
MILFPRWFPIHTYRMWSYCRTVYMPMSYIYGRRYQGPVSDIVVELREGEHSTRVAHEGKVGVGSGPFPCVHPVFSMRGYVQAPSAVYYVILSVCSMCLPAM